MILPSLLIITAIAALLTSFAEIPAVQHALAGIRVAVVVLVGFSVWKLMKSGVKGGFGWCLFLLVFFVSAIWGLSPVVVVLVSAASGWIAGYLRDRGGAA